MAGVAAMRAGLFGFFAFFQPEILKFVTLYEVEGFQSRGDVGMGGFPSHGGDQLCTGFLQAGDRFFHQLCADAAFLVVGIGGQCLD